MFYHALEIDEGSCIGCSRCMKICPTEAVRIRNGKASIMEDRCIDCGKCHAACPVGAIYIKQDDFKKVHEVTKEKKVNPNDKNQKPSTRYIDLSSYKGKDIFIAFREYI